eukprot:m.64893 g.64893  ORF g.64893 m.64893 type:complete len:369 (+) comp8254_c0_seq1:305-1411(+)
MATTGVPSGVELTALLKDLSDKQELSDSLQKALANHHDVIAQLGNEMVALTKAQARYEKENAALTKEIAEYESKSILTTNQLYEADHDTLSVAHATLTQRLSFIQEENRISVARIQTLQNELLAQNELNIKIEALQRAHEAQRALLVSLNERLRTSVAEKRDLVRNQKAIAELERMADETARLAGDVSGAVVESPVFALLRADNAALEKKTAEARRRATAVQELQDAGTDLAALQRYRREVEARHDDLMERNLIYKRHIESEGGPAAAHEGLEPTSAEAAAQAKQRDLLDLSRQNAAEELALEMKIMEARSIALHGFSSASAFVLNESGEARRAPAPPSKDYTDSASWQLQRLGTPPARLAPLDTSQR